jgi:hypothetical protein
MPSATKSKSRWNASGALGEVLRTKPVVAEEWRNAIYCLHEVFPSVVNDVDLRLRQAWPTPVTTPRGLSRQERSPESDSALGLAAIETVTRSLLEVTRETLLDLRLAGLYPSDEHVKAVFRRILEEFDLAGYMLKEVMGGDSATRRPRFTMTHRIRSDALLALRTQQVTLLRQWRGVLAANDNASADRLAADLLLCINAIGSGLRTTG